MNKNVANNIAEKLKEFRNEIHIGLIELENMAQESVITTGSVDKWDRLLITRLIEIEKYFQEITEVNSKNENELNAKIYWIESISKILDNTQYGLLSNREKIDNLLEELNVIINKYLLSTKK